MNINIIIEQMGGWTFLKGSYDAIQVFLYLWVLQADNAQIRSLKLQRLKSQNQRDILYQIKTRPRPSKTSFKHTPRLRHDVEIFDWCRPDVHVRKEGVV